MAEADLHDATPQDAGLHDERGPVLLGIARAAIASALDRPCPADPSHSWLDEAGATFVTLSQDGNLRGCIGSLEAHRPLRDDVKGNARAAAFRDPRFRPLEAFELDITRVEVSLLSPMQPMPVASEADALAQVQPHVDGLLLEWGRHRGTFLPQVWESLPDARDFLSHLKLKAGLPQDFWSDAIRLSRYHVIKWREPEAGQRVQ